MAGRIVIVGAGLAGLAAASAWPRGFRVTLLESRNRTGGRAGSFTDAATGQLIDACQHVSMGCCTNLAHFCRTVGVAHLLAPQPRLYFMTPDRSVSTMAADRLPAPFHLASSFLRAHYLSPIEKLRIAWGLARLRMTSPIDDQPFGDWLRRHKQTPRTLSRFWGVIVVSALNEDLDVVGLKYARKVFIDGFMGHRRGFEVELPTVPLGQLYGSELNGWLERHDVELLLNHGVRRLCVDQGRVVGIELRSGQTMTADWYISAAPFDRLLEMLPVEVVEGETYFANLRRLETSPITSVHLWYDRPVLGLPHVVLIDCVGHWVFNRGEGQGLHYLQVVVSAAPALRGLGHEVVCQRIVEEIQTLFPAAAQARLLRSRVVTEHAATFSAVPGCDRWRPTQSSPIANLLIAGDWTQTGWPATMEGAVRSGYLAAEAVLERMGRRERLVRADL